MRLGNPDKKTNPFPLKQCNSFLAWTCSLFSYKMPLLPSTQQPTWEKTQSCHEACGTGALGGREKAASVGQRGCFCTARRATFTVLTAAASHSPFHMPSTRGPARPPDIHHAPAHSLLDPMSVNQCIWFAHGFKFRVLPCLLLTVYSTMQNGTHWWHHTKNTAVTKYPEYFTVKKGDINRTTCWSKTEIKTLTKLWIRASNHFCD